MEWNGVQLKSKRRKLVDYHTKKETLPYLTSKLTPPALRISYPSFLPTQIIPPLDIKNMKLQKTQHEPDPPSRQNSAGVIQAILQKPICKIMKEAKPTIHKIQVSSSHAHIKKKSSTEYQSRHQNWQSDNEKKGSDLHKEYDSSLKGGEESGRERIKRHRVELAGEVRIPDTWGQENFLNDWIDCSAFDSALAPSGIMSASAALAEHLQLASS